MSRYAIGVDFGTESGRAIIVDVADGTAAGHGRLPVQHGVIDERLPLRTGTVTLPPDWALQDPDDYLRVFQQAVPAVLRDSGVDPADVIGLGIDFTACTMLPVKADGTPLCVLPELRANPHAWVKLWKHHAAQPEADRINETAARPGRGVAGPSTAARSAPSGSSQGAPDPRRGARGLRGGGPAHRGRRLGRLAADRRRDPQRLHRRLQGDVVEARRLPRQRLLRGARPAPRGRRRHEDDARHRAPMGERAGGLSDEAAAWTGLRPGTAVAVANVDAHVAVPAATVTEPGRMVMIMGTSTCHMVLVAGRARRPGHVRLRARTGSSRATSATRPARAASATTSRGSSSTPCRRPTATRRASAASTSTPCSRRRPPRCAPGESGLLALDWWNGNRSVLVDAELGGLLIGATLATTRPRRSTAR